MPIFRNIVLNWKLLDTGDEATVNARIVTDFRKWILCTRQTHPYRIERYSCILKIIRKAVL